MSSHAMILPSTPPPSFRSLDRSAVVRFGRYELIGELASGGMGVVYLARLAGEAGFQRLFAVKVMHEHLARQQEFVEMLLDEARMASRLHHPNVVPIVDLGGQDGRHFLVMDYVEGCSLSQLCRRHRRERPSRLMVPIILDVLEGLQAAHTLVDEDDKPLHLVHRDMSAQNVMVGVDGSARVIDFGIAKAEARISSTRPGTLKGKLAFMAPEQLIDAGAIDARSDIFSVGAMLWTTLTATRLFQADSESATLTNVLHKPVPAPSAVGLKPPACYDEICLRALERDPARRFASAAEMASALRQAALKGDSLASRADIAAFVKATFRSEFAARREAIRAHSASPPTPLGLGSIDELASIPALTDTPSSAESTPSSDVRLADVVAAVQSESAGAGVRDGADSANGGAAGAAATASVEPAAKARIPSQTDPSIEIAVGTAASSRRRYRVLALGALGVAAIAAAVIVSMRGPTAPTSASIATSGDATGSALKAASERPPAAEPPGPAAGTPPDAPPEPTRRAATGGAADVPPASPPPPGRKPRGNADSPTTTASKAPADAAGAPSSTAPSLEVNPYVR